MLAPRRAIRARHRWRSLALPALLLACLAAPAAASASTISGTAFQDADRDGAFDIGEAPFANHQLFVLTAGGEQFVASARTDASGRYAVSGLADGDYRVQYDSATSNDLVASWVPTTTGSVRSQVEVHLAGAATADFGWRPLVHSADITAPISVYTGPSGLRVESFNDAVTAREIHDATALMLVGAEAPSVTIRFGYQTDGGGMTTTSTAQSGSTYTSYSAYSWIPYVSWVQRGDRTLAHEYGHAWSQYFAKMVQQDGTFAAYLQARGLKGDPRVGTSYGWDVNELIAEDYRQLFGTPNAQTGGQINGDIPLAKDVPGLKEFLRDTFTRPLAGPPPPPPPPAPSLTVTGLAVSPAPVQRSATVSATLSVPATVTMAILDAKGATVRSLLSNAAKPAGVVSATWDRKDAAGRKVRAGTYTASLRAVSTDGQSVTRTLAFTAS